MANDVIVGIYRLTAPSGAVYIGQAVDIYRRWRRYQRLYKTVQGQPKLYNALKKYGPASFQYEILMICPEEFLDKYEVLLIRLSDSWKNGLNLKEGGKSGGRCSAETKMKISIKAKARGSSCSEANRQKYRDLGLQRCENIVYRNHLTSRLRDNWSNQECRIKNLQSRKNYYNSRPPKYRLIDSTGNSFTPHNMRQFCRDRNLEESCFRRLRIGALKSYKG